MAKGSAQKHIFVMNDEPVLLRLFEKILERAGFRATLDTFRPSSVEEQYARILETEPDLIVLDFMFGGEPLGWQFLQYLRMQAATETVPIVVCSAEHALLDEMKAHLNAMGVCVVRKPFRIDDLLCEICNALDAAPDDLWSAAKSSPATD
jgi:DNA-binding response OmpR family regulator